MTNEDAIMTNEDAISVIKMMIPLPRRGDGKSTTHLLQTLAISMAIEALQERKTGKWISVKERLPKENGNYLCYIVNPYDHRLRYHMVCGFNRNLNPFSDEHYWFPDDETASNNVVAWMPLPEPYEEVDE